MKPRTRDDFKKGERVDFFVDDRRCQAPIQRLGATHAKLFDGRGMVQIPYDALFKLQETWLYHWHRNIRKVACETIRGKNQAYVALRGGIK